MIRAVRALIPGFKSLSKILDDTQNVTGLVSDAASGVEDAVLSLTDSTEEMADFIKENRMNNMITIGDAILLLIGICVILLLIYMIRAVRVLIPGFKSLSKILDDTQNVTGLVSDAALGVEDAVLSLTDSTEEIADFIRDNQSSLKAVLSLINAVVSIKKLFS
jgi:uncharacterized protein YoxC